MNTCDYFLMVPVWAHTSHRALEGRARQGSDGERSVAPLPPENRPTPAPTVFCLLSSEQTFSFTRV